MVKNKAKKIKSKKKNPSFLEDLRKSLLKKIILQKDKAEIKEEKAQSAPKEEKQDNLPEEKKSIQEPSQEKEAEFVAPIVSSLRARESPNFLEQATLDAPRISEESAGIKEGYVSSASAYQNSSYTSSQKYRSGSDNYSSKEFNPDLRTHELEKPIFRREPVNISQDFSRSKNQNFEEPRVFTQYEIQKEETSHHGVRKRKTEIF